MPPEAERARVVSERALELWKELSALYDEVEAALGGRSDAGDLARLGPAIVESEAELRPLVSEIGLLRARLPEPGEALTAIWLESDRLIAGLVDRQPRLTRAAMEAREGASKALARVRSARMGATAYRGMPASDPRFASRQA